MIRGNLWMLLVCWFFGVTLISVAGGALYPPINIIAKPFVCANGAMEFKQAVYNPSPGQTITTTTWVCTDASSGENRIIGVWELVLPAGIIDGSLVFVLVVIIRAVLAYRGGSYSRFEQAAQARQEVFERQPAAAGSPAEGGSMKDAADELGKLKQLVDARLITQQDYDQKKAEILRRL